MEQDIEAVSIAQLHPIPRHLIFISNCTYSHAIKSPGVWDKICFDVSWGKTAAGCTVFVLGVWPMAKEEEAGFKVKHSPASGCGATLLDKLSLLLPCLAGGCYELKT